jgi:UDP-2,4-diacetamido-2,4,6-trideoxy-beta-L-altropyranose hydrolase
MPLFTGNRSKQTVLNITVRVDAGAEIGLGHLVRVQAVIEALRALTPINVIYVTRLPLPGENTMQIPSEVMASEEGAWIAWKLPQTDVLLADLYRPTQAQLRSLRRFDWRLVCIDDESPFYFDCDLLINPNLHTDFEHDRAPETDYLYGSEAILLRQQFHNPIQRHCREDVEHILLAFGGSDPTRLTSRVCQWLRDRLPESVWRVSVMIGSAFADAESLRLQLADDSRWRLQRNVSNVRALLETADLGIIAAGGTLYEAAATGLPTLSVAINAAQEREAVSLAEAGATHFLGTRETLTTQTTLDGLNALLDGSVRQTMADRAQAVLDGDGCCRVAQAILNLGLVYEEFLCAA